jgi:pyrroloquinoline quinone biosynthesis protein B
LPLRAVRAVPVPPYLVVLGTAQDGGYPQAGCRDACCAVAWADPARRRCVASAAVVVPSPGDRAARRWLIDATPDLGAQLHLLDELAPPEAGAPPPALAGILLTHGHLGHTLGLALLGQEAMGARRVPVYAMPGLLERLGERASWRALVAGGHVQPRPLRAGAAVPLGGRVSATPERVPHRGAAETVALRIRGPERTVLYLPDIDGWDVPLGDEPAPPLDARLQGADVAYLDGTFGGPGELPRRDPADVPHPTIEDTLRRLEAVPESVRRRVRFTHLNHTNPVLDAASPLRAAVRAAGCDVADDGECVPL